MHDLHELRNHQLQSTFSSSRLSQSDRRSGHREPLQGPPLHEHPHPPREHLQPIHFALESQQNAQNPRIPRGSLRSAAPNPHCRAQRDGSGFSISLIAEWVVPEQSSAVIFAFSVASSSWSGSAYFFVRFLRNRLIVGDDQRGSGRRDAHDPRGALRRFRHRPDASQIALSRPSPAAFLPFSQSNL